MGKAVSQENVDALVVGGGFFGAYLALLLKERSVHPVIVEREPDLMQRASYHNQARVHSGYHYPRSLVTAVRSRINFPRFLRDFPECIFEDFEKYYAVGRILGKVTAGQYENFMARVGASLEPAPERIRRLFDPHLVEKVWAAREVAFDAGKLRETMRRRLVRAGIRTHLGWDAVKLFSESAQNHAVECRNAKGERRSFHAPWIFNCTYSCLNRLRQSAELPLIPLKHELTEMVLVEPPPEIRNVAVTVMCGPYFSLMPFPDRNLWSISHVRYTPHHSWIDGKQDEAYDHFDRSVKTTHAPMMLRDAARFMPAIAKCIPRDSLWEVKTVLPQCEQDDGRPILFHHDPGVPGFVSILGGKIDNVYDLSQELEALKIGKGA